MERLFIRGSVVVSRCFGMIEIGYGLSVLCNTRATCLSRVIHMLPKGAVTSIRFR
jgi:hypothetical protein